MVERILELLKKNNMTAKELTELLGINKSSVTDWKNGKTKPGVEHIIGISQIFGVSTDYLLIGLENKLPENEQPQRISDESLNADDFEIALARLRTNDALTQRMQEVAREVYSQLVGDGNKD